MAKPILDDALWDILEPVFPPPQPQWIRYAGRRLLTHRQVLTEIMFVLKTGIPWEELPQEIGCGSRMTCWRRLEAWQQAGVWDKVIALLHAADQFDWSQAVVDSASVRAVLAAQTGPNATDHRKSRSKHHVITDGTVRVWDIEQLRLDETFRDDGVETETVVESRNGRKFLAGSYDGSVDEIEPDDL